MGAPGLLGPLVPRGFGGERTPSGCHGFFRGVSYHHTLGCLLGRWGWLWRRRRGLVIVLRRDGIGWGRGEVGAWPGVLAFHLLGLGDVPSFRQDPGDLEGSCGRDWRHHAWNGHEQSGHM